MKKPLKVYQTAFKAYIESVKAKQAVETGNNLTQKAYDIKLADYKEKKRLYDEAQAAYLIDNELYKKKKAQYDDAKVIYKMVAERGVEPWVQTRFDLPPEELADGETTTLYSNNRTYYVFDKRRSISLAWGMVKLPRCMWNQEPTDSDLTTTNPYADNEIEWAVVKVGDKFDVTSRVF